MRVVSYAVDGAGVGAITRLAAIGRWIRRITARAGAPAELFFLTSADADGLLRRERFAAFKFPSAAAVAEAGLDRLVYLELARQWVWHSLGLLRPDLLVVDAPPRGAFGELVSALDLCRKRAFVRRIVGSAPGEPPEEEDVLPLYDALLVPEEDPDGAPPLPEAARSKVRHAGPILLRDRAELLPRGAARERLGVPEGEPAVYVSAGSGGDGAEQQIAFTIAELRKIGGLCLVVGAGPLYRGARLHGADVRWLSEPVASELMAGLDLAVCSAGYHTFHELMHAGVPAVLLPQAGRGEDSARRAARGARAGAAIALERPDDAAALRRAVEALLRPPARAAAAEAARALVPRNHASDAAAALLRLVLPARVVDAALGAESQ